MRLAHVALVLAGLLVTAEASAQKQKPGKSDGGADSPDSIVLKNGTMVSGKILDDDPKTGITIKLPNGKVRVIAPADIKLVDRAESPKKDAPPEPPAKEFQTTSDDYVKPKSEPAPVVQSSFEHTGTHFGVGLDLAIVLSRENADAKLKLLSPSIGIHGAIDSQLSGGLYLRLEPLFATFSRTSSVKVVKKIDTTDPSNVTIVQDTISNQVRVYDISLRAQLGYDWSASLTSRLGLRGGLDIASGGATDCSGNSRTSFGYGLATTPIVARFGESKAIEVGVYFDYLSLTMPRCSVGDVNGFVAPANAVTLFTPQVSDEKVSVGELGLSGTYMFW